MSTRVKVPPQGQQMNNRRSFFRTALAAPLAARLIAEEAAPHAARPMCCGREMSARPTALIVDCRRCGSIITMRDWYAMMGIL